MRSLVLLPGLDGTGELFEPLLAHLPKDVNPIVIEYPADQELDYKALTQLVLERLPTESPYVLLGESFSGPVAVMVASRRPAGLLGVVLCATFLILPRSWLARLSGFIPFHVAARMCGPRLLMGRFRSQVMAQRLRRALAQVPSHTLRARVEAAAQVDVTLELSALDIPVLYLQASEDQLIPRSAAAAFERAAKRGKVNVVEGPHFLLQCNPGDAFKSFEDLFHASSSAA